MAHVQQCLKTLSDVMFRYVEAKEYLLLQNSDRNKIKTLMNDIKSLSKTERYALQLQFSNNILKTITGPLPLELLWWLHSSQLLYLSTYIYFNLEKCSNISTHLSSLLFIGYDERKSENISIETTPTRIISRDLIIALIKGAEGPQISLGSEASFSEWAKTSDIMLQSLIRQALERLLSTRNDNKPYNYLKDVRESCEISGKILHKLYLSHLRVIMQHQPYTTAQSAVTNQRHWTKDNAHPALVDMLTEIFTQIKDPLRQLIDIMLQENEVSWKWCLIALSVCVKVIRNSGVTLKKILEELLDAALNTISTSTDKILIVFLIARQACHEKIDLFESYATWYTKTFGTNSAGRTASNEQSFKCLVKFLTDMIPSETEECLQVHCEKQLAIPPNCLATVAEYKGIARTRLIDLKAEIPNYKMDDDGIVIID